MAFFKTIKQEAVRLPVFLCAFILCSYAAAESSVLSAEFQFTREQTSGGMYEKTSGTAYNRSSPHFFCVVLTHPFPQHVIFSEKETLLYYPQKNEAVQILYASPQIMTLEIEFLSLLDEDKGLGLLGYVLDRVQPIAGVYRAFWKNIVLHSGTQPKADILKAETMHDSDQRITSLIFISEKTGKKVMETVYSMYTQSAAAADNNAVADNAGGLLYPQMMTTESFNEKGESVSKSVLTMHAVILNKQIPLEIENFALPDGCSVTRVGPQ